MTMKTLIVLAFALMRVSSVSTEADDMSWTDDWDQLPFNDTEWDSQALNDSSLDLIPPLAPSFDEDVKLSAFYSAKCDRSDLCSSVFTSFPVCQCDEKCLDYGDCCFQVLNKTENFSRQTWQCLPLSIHEHHLLHEQIFALMIETCPWGSDELITAKCQRQDGPRHGYTHLMDVPVYSKKSGAIYPNIYCAQCNSDDKHLRPWNVTVRCDSESFRDNLSQLVTTGEARYVRGNRRWVLNGTNHECKMDIENFESLLGFAEESGVRQCVQSIDYCPEEWPELDDKLKCPSYTSYVETQHKSDYRVFKNRHCAICNGVPPKEIHCYGILFRDYAAPVRSLHFHFTRQVNFNAECHTDKDAADFLFSDAGCNSLASTSDRPQVSNDEAGAKRETDGKSCALCAFLSKLTMIISIMCLSITLSS